MAHRDIDMRNEMNDRTDGGRTEPDIRRRPETKTFLASSEFWVMVGALVALFIGGYVLNDISNGAAWRFATWVAIAYVVSRGLAKAGSQRSYDTVRDRDI